MIEVVKEDDTNCCRSQAIKVLRGKIESSLRSRRTRDTARLHENVTLHPRDTVLNEVNENNGRYVDRVGLGN